MKDEARGPVAFPPPLIYVIAFLAGLGIDSLWPIPHALLLWSHGVGAALVIVSAVIIAGVLTQFYRAGTPFNVRKPARALITGGPYRISRNPGYLSLTILYLGLAFLLNNGWVLLFVAPAFVAMDRWIVPSEERHLVERFGEEYGRYKKRVRRWL